MSEEGYTCVSDEDYEIAEEDHAKLIENVISLDDKQHIRKATRTEPSTIVSDLHLVNSLTGKHGRVYLNELAKSLKGDKRFSKIGWQVETFHKSSKTLEKPLEKPQEDRLKRTVGYENLKNELTTWDPIVTHNRAAINLTFPLEKDINLSDDKKITSRFRIKSDIQKEMESLEPKVEVHNVGEQNKFALTMEEIKERRKETAKLRAVQSYRAAKARRESKIKSRKFHRIQRKERLRKEFKEFEELQKTNPEEALKKLEEIEKIRAEERVTLRHKSTGKWARNKQIRAKYDKDSRQALVQQLQLSRELTEKVKYSADTESDEDEDVNRQNVQINSGTNENNPWTNGKVKVSQEVGDFVSGYRKFWNEQNKNLNELGDEAENSELNGITKSNENKISSLDDNKRYGNSSKSNTIAKQNFTKNNITILKETETESSFDKRNNPCVKKLVNKNRYKIKDSVNVLSKDEITKTKVNNRIKANTPKKLAKPLSTSDWEVNAIDADTVINNMPYIIQTKLEKNLERKAKKLKKTLGLIDRKCTKNIKKKNNTKVKKLKVAKDLLALPSKPKHAILNEEMIEDISRKSERDILQGSGNTQENSLDIILSVGSSKNSEESFNLNSNLKDIDPNKFMNAKAAILNTGIPDLLGYDDNFENENQESAIAEAFRDDEIINEFAREKQAQIDKEKPKDIDLALPGWGSWGGVGIKFSTRKKKRFVCKFPKVIPRKDNKKGNLIVKDNKKSIKPHLVSELPFPFKSVKDFEASIRAPIGNTFIPETAFRKNILPAVMTKIGTIIKPIDKEILLKKKK